MDTIFMYLVALVLFTISWIKSREKTRKALLKGLKAIEMLLPQLIVVVLLIAATLPILDPRVISRFVGSESGFLGMIAASLIGSVTLIPGFVAFPIAGELLRNGAGVLQIASFVSALMMVGIITFPMEASFFGVKVAVLRNTFALVFTFIAAFFVAWVVGI